MLLSYFYCGAPCFFNIQLGGLMFCLSYINNLSTWLKERSIAINCLRHLDKLCSKDCCDAASWWIDLVRTLVQWFEVIIHDASFSAVFPSIQQRCISLESWHTTIICSSTLKNMHQNPIYYWKMFSDIYCHFPFRGFLCNFRTCNKKCSGAITLAF